MLQKNTMVAHLNTSHYFVRNSSGLFIFLKRGGELQHNSRQVSGTFKLFLVKFFLVVTKKST